MFVSKRVKKKNPGHKKLCPARDIKYRQTLGKELIDQWGNCSAVPKMDDLWGSKSAPKSAQEFGEILVFPEKSEQNGDESCSWAPKKWASGDPYCQYCQVYQRNITKGNGYSQEEKSILKELEVQSLNVPSPHGPSFPPSHLPTRSPRVFAASAAQGSKPLSRAMIGS